MVLRRPGEVGAEVARPMTWEDAKRFSRVTIWVTTLLVGMAALAAYVWVPDSSLWRQVVPLNVILHRPPLEYPMYVLLVGPMAPVVVVAVVTFFGLVAGVWWVQLWFWMFRFTWSREIRNRAAAVACYGATWFLTTGILISVILAVMLGLKLIMLEELPDLREMWSVVLLGLLAMIWLFVGMLRMTQRATDRGGIGVAMAAVGVPVGSVVAFAVAGGVVHYVMGLAAIMWASLWQVQ